MCLSLVSESSGVVCLHPPQARVENGYGLARRQAECRSFLPTLPQIDTDGTTFDVVVLPVELGVLFRNIDSGTFRKATGVPQQYYIIIHSTLRGAERRECRVWLLSWYISVHLMRLMRFHVIVFDPPGLP